MSCQESKDPEETSQNHSVSSAESSPQDSTSATKNPWENTETQGYRYAQQFRKNFEAKTGCKQSGDVCKEHFRCRCHMAWCDSEFGIIKRFLPIETCTPHERMWDGVCNFASFGGLTNLHIQLNIFAITELQNRRGVSV